MIQVLPNGFLTIVQAAEVLLPATYAGVPDLPIIAIICDLVDQRK